MRLDLGCGTAKREGFIGVDVRKFDGVDVICDLGKDKWPWLDDTVEEVYCGHMLEHLKPEERIHFANELCRVLKKGGKARIDTPHWASARAYGDLTHQWPPVSEMWYIYLNREWREKNAPHSDFYTCDFDHAVVYTLHPEVTPKNDGTRNWMVTFCLEARQDLQASLIKR